MDHYDLLCIGNYTKDTIVTPAGTQYVDGGAVNYAAHAAKRLGSKVAVITRLAQEDERVVSKFTAAGIACYPTYTPFSTTMKLEYPTTNPDIPGYVTAVCEPTAPRSPVRHAATVTAPVLLVHGELDTRVPTEQSLRMQEALGSAGRPARLLLVPGAAHGFTADQEAVARPVVDEFLAMELR